MHVRKLCAAGLVVCAAVSAAGLAAEGRRWWSHVEYLADDKLEGRLTGSEGHRKAAAYVAGEFERAGLKPAGVSGYLQPVAFDARRIVESGCSLDLVRNGSVRRIRLGEEAAIGARIDAGPATDAPLVFAGYALTVPEMNYDDLAGLDLRGKIVVALAGGPSSIPGPLRAHYQSASERNVFLRKAGVVGMITIPNPRHMDIPWARAVLSRFQPAMSLAGPGMNEDRDLRFGAMWNPEHADLLLEGSGHHFAELVELAEAGKPLPRFPLPASVRARVKLERWKVDSQNVAGILTGSDPKLKDEYVVLSAHLDHLGVGEPIAGDRIYNGAMDDASGVASLIEIARGLSAAPARPRRSVLFVAVTGEEKGLLGSKYFAGHPTVARKSMVADLNVDMFLPLFPLKSVTVYGLNESDLGAMAREAARSLGIQVRDDQEPQRNLFIRSDQYSFIRGGVPALAFKVGYEKGSPEERIAKTWLKERYHAPSDDVKQPVDLEAAAGFNRLILRLARAVADRPERPRWNANSFFKRFAD